MRLADVAPQARQLSRHDKLQLIKLLAGDLTEDPAAPPSPLEPGVTYDVLTPFACDEAASVLLQELEARKGRS